MSFIVIVLTLAFSTLTAISIVIPDIPAEIKKDLMKGINSLCEGDIKNYYSIYNTRKLTEIEKTKFYDKITETQEIIDSEKELFNKYKLKIQIKDVSIIKKIGDNLFLCNLNVNYKSRVNDSTTQTKNITENYIVKIIDVGNMDYKILLPFNSMDKDFSSSNIYKSIKEVSLQKQAEIIKKQREEEEKQKELEKLKQEEENKKLENDELEHNATIIEDNSLIEDESLIEDSSDNESNETSNSTSNHKPSNSENPNENSHSNSSNKNEEPTSAYEDFINN